MQENQSTAKILIPGSRVQYSLLELTTPQFAPQKISLFWVIFPKFSGHPSPKLGPPWQKNYAFLEFSQEGLSNL